MLINEGFVVIMRVLVPQKPLRNGAGIVHFTPRPFLQPYPHFAGVLTIYTVKWGVPAETWNGKGDAPYIAVA